LVWIRRRRTFEELIVEQAEENITKALTTAPLKMVKELENTHLVEEYRAEKEETFLESLNMLYGTDSS
jgi:hypothetical protein